MHVSWVPLKTFYVACIWLYFSVWIQSHKSVHMCMYPGYRIKHFILPVSDCISERLYMHINIFFVSVRPGGGPAPQPPLDHPRSTSSARKFSATDGGAATTADATAAAAAAVFTAPAGLRLPGWVREILLVRSLHLEPCGSTGIRPTPCPGIHGMHGY